MPTASGPQITQIIYSVSAIRRDNYHVIKLNAILDKKDQENLTKYASKKTIDSALISPCGGRKRKKNKNSAKLKAVILSS